MAFMNIDTRPHVVTDCSLCRRLQGKRLTYPRNIGQDPGLELILPEETNQYVPWIRLNACGHCYHVHCLARLNPKKYTNIDVRSADGRGGLIQIDEYDCLDCAGTQPNNSRFNPTMPAGTITDVISKHTNAQDVFEHAENVVNRYNQRKANLRRRILITTILNPVDYTRQSITTALDQMSVQIRLYAKDSLSARPLPVPGHSIPSSYIFYQNGEPLNPEMPYSTLLSRVTVGFDWNKLFTKELNLRQICHDLRTDSLIINRMNEIVLSFKRCREGVEDVTELEKHDYVALMLHAPTDREAPLCALNRHGQRKRFVVFDDFPVTENPGRCSISGGKTRKYKRKSIRRK